MVHDRAHPQNSYLRKDIIVPLDEDHPRIFHEYANT